MKFLKIDLLTLLVSLFVFSSCQNTSTIGLEVDPSAKINGELIDTATINSRTIKEDDAPTYSTSSFLTRYPLGSLTDPTFGTTDASLAFSVNLPNDEYSFGTDAVLDSAVLVLNYSTEFYGDSTSKYSLDVHQLSNNLTKESSYLSSKSYSKSLTSVGNYTGKVFPATPYKVTDIVAGGPDTLRYVSPQIRIRLNNNFITNSILNLSANALKRNAYFQDAFKGLHVEVNKGNSSGKGGLMFFNFDSSSSETGLVLYYRKKTDASSTSIDTVSVRFPINASANSAVATTLKHNYTGTPVDAQLTADSKIQFTETYLQPLAGVRNKISFPYLTKFKKEIGKVIVNRAELVIDLKSGTDVSPFKPAQRLALYRYDIAGQRQNVPDNDVGTVYGGGDKRANPSSFGGYFNSVTKQYVFVITSYIQDLLDGKTEDYGTFLAPSPSSEFVFSPPYSTGARSVIGAFKKSPSAGDNVMKLNIYLTKVK
ncbi:DUF4270 domain-containing protein [Pedobacter sp.]|uniref:DUF4270 domain-containing protein n=1 Tax=Pedobacter sp. TaxID=1411316 RepID=UPI00396C73B2